MEKILSAFLNINSYSPERVVYLENKKYVAVVKSFLHADVYYYDYYGPLFMGAKIRVHRIKERRNFIASRC